jgi:hypothetical protein
MGYVKGNQTNHLKNFSVTIDGIKLNQSQIYQLKIKWSMTDFMIQGFLSFIDETSLVEEIPIRGGNIVMLEMTDADDELLKQKMEVVNITYQRAKSKDSYIVNLELIDIPSMKALGTYKEMSWEKVDMIEMIDHPETLKPFLTDKEKDFGPPPPKHENFVMPLDRSFYKVTEWLKNNNNMLFFQDRKKYYIQPISYFNAKGPLDSDPYIYKPHNQNYRKSIYELETDYGNKITAHALQPKGKNNSMDIFEKHIKYEEEDYQGIISKVGSKGSTPNDYGDTDVKHFYSSDYHIKERTEFMYAKNGFQDLTLEILVPGRFKTNAGEIVKVDLINMFSLREPEKNISGMWLVKEIVDYIQVPDFVQKLVLVKSKFKD